MFGLTRCVAAVAFGAGRGEAALLAVPVIPAAALADVARDGVAWLRRAAARALRAAAEVLDPAPVAELPAPPAQQDVPAEAAPVLVMASAAQVTAEEAPPEVPALDAAAPMEAALKRHATARAAARALGIAESTFRCRARKLGVKLPGRKAAD